MIVGIMGSQTSQPNKTKYNENHIVDKCVFLTSWKKKLHFENIFLIKQYLCFENINNNYHCKCLLCVKLKRWIDWSYVGKLINRSLSNLVSFFFIILLLLLLPHFEIQIRLIAGWKHSSPIYIFQLFKNKHVTNTFMQTQNSWTKKRCSFISNRCDRK